VNPRSRLVIFGEADNLNLCQTAMKYPVCLKPLSNFSRSPFCSTTPNGIVNLSNSPMQAWSIIAFYARTISSAAKLSLSGFSRIEREFKILSPLKGQRNTKKNFCLRLKRRTFENASLVQFMLSPLAMIIWTAFLASLFVLP